MTTASIRAILFDIAPTMITEEEEPLARIDRFIGYAGLEIVADEWGDKADMATALLAAHMLTLSTRGGSNQGAVIKERVGELERGYASPGTVKGDPAYSATSYGLELQRLAAGPPITPTARKWTPFTV